MLIVGRGMIASAFRDCGIKNDNLLIFASGVSNSNETDWCEFDREKRLLSAVITEHQSRKIVYFSSCAIGFQDTPYYRHKLEMEKFIENSERQYLVCRLPQVVGLTTNTTLVSYIVKCIRNNKAIPVVQNATRNLIDVQDVVRIVLRLADLKSMRIQITNGRMMPVGELIQQIASVLEMEPRLYLAQSEPQTANYDGVELRQHLSSSDCIYSDGYSMAVLKKYVPMLPLDKARK